MSKYTDETALYYFNRGVSTAAYLELGCHAGTGEYGERIYRFAVWAPNAEFVSVVGSFNKWNIEADKMHRAGTTGVWELCVGVAHEGDLYKYAIGTYTGEIVMKADPFAGDVARLKGSLEGWRLRVGRWRVLFMVDHEKKAVLIAGLGPRGDIYK